VLRDPAHAVPETWDLSLFSLDVVMSDGLPRIVDVCGAPGFEGIPDAALRLADHIYDLAGAPSAHGTASVVA